MDQMAPGAHEQEHVNALIAGVTRLKAELAIMDHAGHGPVQHAPPPGTMMLEDRDDNSGP
jgi:hypothetical protein